MIRATLIALLTLSAPALAQEVPDQSAAKKLLFGTRNVDLVVTRQPFMSDSDVSTLQALPKVASLQYYGAMAANPMEGLQSEKTRGAFNFHSIEAARAAALSGCGAGCVVVAEILPRRYQPGRALTLSQAASEAVNGRAFRRAGDDAALAVSTATGAWGLGDGAAAAVAACAAAGASDCVVAVNK